MLTYTQKTVYTNGGGDLMSYEANALTMHEADHELLDAYLSSLSVAGRSPKTIERYRYVITKMLQRVATPTPELTVHHLRKYLADEKSRGISERTLEGIREVFSAYFKWLWCERLIDRNPCVNLMAIKYPEKQKDIFTDVDMERMRFCCKTLRDRAIIYFLRATGCRIGELTQINRKDLDLVALECVVVGKGNKMRTVFIDNVTAMVVQQYLDERHDDKPALFIGKGSDRLKPGAVRKMLIELGERAHVQHVHPHKFRRTAATAFIKHGMAIQEVAAILGHEKLDTTMEYILLDKTDIKNSYRKYA